MNKFLKKYLFLNNNPVNKQKIFQIGNGELNGYDNSERNKARNPSNT